MDCSVPGCTREVNDHGLCLTHRRRQRRYGSTELPRPSILDRLSEHFSIDPAGCWVWLTPSKRDGYGRVSIDGRQQLAHRVSYELFIGPIPDGLQIDHLCRNRACINPTHLEPVTDAENKLRGISPPAENARKEACPSGHPYTITPKGYRRCRKCDQARQNERRRAHRGG